MAKAKMYITSTIFTILHVPEEETTFSVCVVVAGQAGYLNSTQIRLRKLCPQTQCHVIKSGHILNLYSTYSSYDCYSIKCDCKGDDTVDGNVS